jgi:hypothetical protein
LRIFEKNNWSKKKERAYMESTIYCVFCGSPLFGRPKVSVSAKKVRYAVANGFSPNKNAMGRIAGQLGLSLEETHQAFFEDVQGLDSDWIICPNCAKRIDNYGYSFLGLHMNPKIAVAILAILVIMLVLLLHSMGFFK